MRVNSKSNEHISIANRDIEDVTSFTYLGSVINITGGTDEDVLARMGKARSAFNILAATKIRIFNSNVKPVLLYSSETWRMTEKTVSKLQTFANRCPAQNPPDLLARYYQQCYLVGDYRSTTRQTTN